MAASVAVIIGESELAENSAVVRDLDKSEQETVAMDEVPSYVEKLLAADGDA